MIDRTPPAQGSGNHSVDTDATSPRRIRLRHFIVLVLVYVASAQVLTILAAGGHPSQHAELTSLENIVIRLIVPVGLGSMLAVAYVAWSRQWQPIFVELRRLPRPVLLVPVTLFILALGISNYGGLSARGFAFAGLLFVGTMMVGFAEELVFRGVGVQALRQHGLSESKVALWSSAIFGVSHGSNAIITGKIVDALIQVVLTTATGFMFYLVKRGTGALAMAMLFHGLWDFSVLSGHVDPANPTSLSTIAAVVLGALLLTALLLRRQFGLVGSDANPSVR